MNKNLLRKSISLIVACVFVLQQLPAAVPDAYALSAGHFTTPFSPLQEQANAVRTFITANILRLGKSGYDFENVPLAKDLFSTVNLADSSVKGANQSKRIDVRNVVYDGEKEEYVLGCTVNGVPFTARFKIDGGQPQFTSIEKYDPDEALFFPAVASGSTGQPDPVQQKIDEATQTARRIIREVNNNGGRTNITSADNAALGKGLELMLKKGLADNLFTGIPDAPNFFTRISGLSAQDILSDNGNRVMLRQLAEKIKESSTYPEAMRSDLAAVFCSISEIFYPQRKNSSLRRMANIKCEFCYGVAHLLDESNLRYHNSWALSLSWSRQFSDARREFDLLRSKIENIMAAAGRDERYQARTILTNMMEAIHNEMRLEIMDLESQPLSFSDDRKSALQSSFLEIRGIFDYLESLSASEHPRTLQMIGMAHCSMARLLKIEYEYRNSQGQGFRGTSPISLTYDIAENLRIGLHHLITSYQMARHKDRNGAPSIPTKHAAQFLVEAVEHTSGVLEYVLGQIRNELIFYPYEKIEHSSDRETEIHGTLRNIDNALNHVRSAIGVNAFSLQANTRTKLDRLRMDWDDDQYQGPEEGILANMRQWLKLQEEIHKKFKEKLTDYLNFVIARDGINCTGMNNWRSALKGGIFQELRGLFSGFFAEEDELELFIDMAVDHIIEINGIDDNFFMAKSAYFNTQPEADRTLERILRTADTLFPRQFDPDEMRRCILRVASFLGLEIVSARPVRRGGAGIRILHQNEFEDSLDVSRETSFQNRMQSVANIFHSLRQFQEMNSVTSPFFDADQINDETPDLEYTITRYYQDAAAFEARGRRWTDVKTDFSERYHEIEARLSGLEGSSLRAIKNSTAFIRQKINVAEMNISSLQQQYGQLDIRWFDTNFASINNLVVQLYRRLNELEAASDPGPITYNAFRDMFGNIKVTLTSIERMVESISEHGPFLSTYQRLFSDLRESQEAARSLGLRLDNPYLTQDYIETLTAFKDTVIQNYALRHIPFDDARFQNDCGAYFRHISPRTQFLNSLIGVLDHADRKIHELSDAARPLRIPEGEAERTKNRILDVLKESISPLPSNFSLLQWQVGFSIPLDQDQTSQFILFLERKIDLMCSLKTSTLEVEDILWRVHEAKRILQGAAQNSPVPLQDKIRRIEELERNLLDTQRNLNEIFERISGIQPAQDEDFENAIQQLEEIKSNEIPGIINDIHPKKAELYSIWFETLDEDIDILQKFSLLWLDKFLGGFVPQNKKRDIEQAFGQILQLMRSRTDVSQNVTALDEKFRELTVIFNDLLGKYYNEFFNADGLRIGRRIYDRDFSRTIGEVTKAVYDDDWYSRGHGRRIKHVLVPIIDENGMITNIELTLTRDTQGASKLIIISPNTQDGSPSYLALDHFQRLYKSHRALGSGASDHIMRLARLIQTRAKSGDSDTRSLAVLTILNIYLGLPVTDEELDIFQVPDDLRNAYYSQPQLEETNDIDDSREIASIYEDLNAQLTQSGELAASADPDLAGININPEYCLLLLAACLEHYRQLVTIDPENSFLNNTPIDVGNTLLQLVSLDKIKQLSRAPTSYEEIIRLLEDKLNAIRAEKRSVRSSSTYVDPVKNILIQDLDRDKAAIEHVIQSCTAWKERHSLQHAKSAIENFLQSAFRVLNKVSARNYNQAITLPQMPAPFLAIPDKDSRPVLNLFAHYPPKQDYGGVYLDLKMLDFKVYEKKKGTQSLEFQAALNTALETYLEQIYEFPHKLISNLDEIEIIRQESREDLQEDIAELGANAVLEKCIGKIEYLLGDWDFRRKDMDKANMAWCLALIDVWNSSIKYNNEADVDDLTYSMFSSLILQLEGELEWFEHFKTIFEALSGESPVNICVVENIPTNSLVLGNTIIFDADFINSLIIQIGGRWTHEEAAYILGERLFHELGHISLKRKKLDRISAEVEQIKRDVIFYEKIYSRDPDFFLKKIEGFTSFTMVRTPKGVKKFSHAFHSARLFKKIQEWAKKFRFDRFYVEKQIEEFVEKEMRRFYVIPPDAQFFPAFPEENESAQISTFIEDSPKAISRLDIAMLDDIAERDSAFLSKNRRIVISTSLIPECQKKLINEVNKRSREAFEAGRTLDLIEIKPLSYIQNLRSDDSCDVVALLEETESKVYTGREKHLVFSRSGNYPVLINGLVAAGRAILYKDMEKLRTILIELSGDKSLGLPEAAQLERLLEESREEFTRILMIVLPSIKMASREIDQLNRNIVHLLQFA